MLAVSACGCSVGCGSGLPRDWLRDKSFWILVLGFRLALPVQFATQPDAKAMGVANSRMKWASSLYIETRTSMSGVNCFKLRGGGRGVRGVWKPGSMFSQLGSGTRGTIVLATIFQSNFGTAWYEHRD